MTMRQNDIGNFRGAARLVSALVLGGVLGLAACSQKPQTSPAPEAEAVAATPGLSPELVALKAATLVAVGSPQKIEKLPEPGAEADVVRVVDLKRAAGGKLFAAAGGDPAINGLHTYLAVTSPNGPIDGWTVYEIGDFNEWELIRESDDSLVLAVSKSRISDADGNAITEVMALEVAMPKPEDTSLQITTLKPKP